MYPGGPPQPFWGQPPPQQSPTQALSPGQNLLQILQQGARSTPIAAAPAAPSYPPYGYTGVPQGYAPQPQPQYAPPMPSAMPIPKLTPTSASQSAVPIPPSSPAHSSSFTGFPLTTSSPSFSLSSQLIENPLNMESIANLPSEWSTSVSHLIAVNHEYICYALKNGQFRVISQSTGKNVLLKGHTGTSPVLDTSFSPHSTSTLLSITSTQFIIWNLSQTESNVSYHITLCVDGMFTRGIWHPTRDIVAVVEGKRVQIWDIQQALRTIHPSTTITAAQLQSTPSLFTSTPAHVDNITSFSFSPHGDLLATTSCDGLLQLINTHTWHVIRAWYPHERHVINHVSFVPYGNYHTTHDLLLTTAQTSDDISTSHREWKLWNSQEWNNIHTLKLEKGQYDVIYNQVRVDPSGSFAAVSYKIIESVGRADDYGFFVFHIRRPLADDHKSWDTSSTRFDYVTPFNTPYPIISFLLLNRTNTYDETHTINDIQMYAVHTKPIQHYILQSHEIYRPVGVVQSSPVVPSINIAMISQQAEKEEGEITARSSDDDSDSDEGEAEIGPEAEVFPLKTVDDIEIKDPDTGLMTTVGARRRSSASASGDYSMGTMEVGEVTVAELDDTLLSVNQSRPTRSSVIEERPTTSRQMESLMDKLVRHSNQEAQEDEEDASQLRAPSVTITDGFSKRGSVVAIMETNAIPARSPTQHATIYSDDEDEHDDRLGGLADDSPAFSSATSSDRRRPPKTRPNSISLSSGFSIGPNVPPSPSFLAQQALVHATQPAGILLGENDTIGSPSPSPTITSSLTINTSADPSHVPPTPVTTPMSTGLSYARHPRKISTSSALPLPPVGEATVNDFANVPTPVSTLHISTSEGSSPATTTPNPTPRPSIGPTPSTPLIVPGSTSFTIPSDLATPLDSPSPSPTKLHINVDTRSSHIPPTPASTPSSIQAYQSFRDRPSTPERLAASPIMSSPSPSGLPPKARGRVQSLIEKKGEYERGVLKGASIVKQEEEEDVDEAKKKSKSAQETALITRLDKLFGRHFTKMVEKLAQDQGLDEEKMQKLIEAMSTAISNTIPQHIESAIKNEVQKNMLPAVGRWLTQLLQKLVTTVLQPALERSLSQSVTSTLTEPSVLMETLSNTITTSLRQPIQDSFRSSFSSVLLPAFEASTRTMFKQITDTFHAIAEQNKSVLEKQVQQSMKSSTIDIKQTNEYKQWEKEKEKARQLHDKEMAELRALRESLTTTTTASQSSLLNEIRTLTSTMNQLVTMNQTMARQIKEMSQQQQIHGQLIQNIQEQGSRQTSGSSSPISSSKEIDPKVEITNLLSVKQFDTAFIRTLSAGSPSLVVWTCSQLDPHILLRTTIPSHRLSSPVQLSLIQQLGFALQTDTALKLSWLRELCHSMDATDGLIRTHVAPIIKEVLHHFDTQMTSITEDYNNPLYDKALNVKRGLNDLLKAATP